MRSYCRTFRVGISPYLLGFFVQKWCEESTSELHGAVNDVKRKTTKGTAVGMKMLCAPVRQSHSPQPTVL
jgi:hypothetical protein